MNADLSRPAHPPKVSGEQFHNTFMCDALISNGNELYDPPSNKGKAYTDTDSDGKTEIITDITCKFKGKLIAMEVKVDPGSETNCIPLSHFRRLFPQLCSKDGSPKKNALEPTLAQFEAYDGGIMTSHGWIILPTRDIRDNKFHPVRYYVVTREEARILISHATVTWLGLVKVLCPNKAPRIKRQVASVSKKAMEPSESNNSNSLSGHEQPPKVKYFSNNKITTPQHPPKVKYTGTVTVKEQQYELPTSKPRSHRRRRRRGRPAHREEEDQADNRPVKFQTSRTNNGKATSLGGRQSVLPHRISTPSQSEITSEYDVTIRYRPGKEMLLTDALSRCPSRASGEIKLDMRVDYIAFSKTWIAKLKDTTREDPILGTVYQLTQQGWPHQRRHTSRMARVYWDFRDQLTTDEELLLMGPRIVIPSCLREEYLQRLHQGHLSATKVQQNACQHLYWPGLDADIADYTRRCQECIC